MFLAWGALFVNVLTPAGVGTVLPIPRGLYQLVAQGSLVVALLFALLANPRVVIRPNLYLVLLSVMAVVALMVSLHSQYYVGSTYRSLRLLGFVLCLWLLTPWWGRRDMALLRAHRFFLWVITGSVVLGAALAPGMAFSESGRLSGTIWPIPATQVAHYAAVLLATSAILWMCRILSGSHALAAAVVTFAVLVGTHTRTALVGIIAGLAVASASLFLGHARVRKTSATTIVVGIAVTTLFAPQIVSWASRGQSAQEASRLTGRTDVWSAALDQTRPLPQQLFGAGLSNKSFDGLPVDSNWVSAFLDVGWLGVVIQATVLLSLLIMAATHVRGPRRAVALFLTVYCIVASVTEVGTTDASPYLLDLAVAASLLASRPRGVPRVL